MSKKSRFREPFDKQHGKWDQTVLKSEWHHFYKIYWSMWSQLSSKKSLLVIGRIVVLFFNTLTACHKYSVLNRDNLTQRILMQSSLKEKNFLNFVLYFWKADKNLNILRERWPSSWCILELRTLKTVVR